MVCEQGCSKHIVSKIPMESCIVDSQSKKNLLIHPRLILLGLINDTVNGSTRKIQADNTGVR